MSRKRIILTIGSILLISTVLYFEMSRFAPNRFIVKSHIVESQKIPSDMNNTSFVYISDVGGDMKNFNKAIKHIHNLKPDLILFSGNLFNHETSDEEKTIILDSLHELKAPLGKFALISISGNEPQMHALNQANFTVLNNNSILISKTSKNPIEINFYGDDSTSVFENSDANYVVSIIEDSETIKSLSNPNFDLLLSGNDTNDINLPFLNQSVKANNIFINKGIGSPSYRLFSNPELILITLKSLQ